MKNETDGAPMTVTRHDLYDLIWETPMRRLAPRFGLSDVGLAKLCKRLSIPRPPVGYWAKKEHGKEVRKAPLPRLEEEPEPVRIQRSPRAATTPAARHDPREPIVDVPAALADPHRLTVRTENSLRRAKPDKEGLVGPRAKQTYDVRVAPDRIDRAMRILDALVKALESQSRSVRIEDPTPIERPEHGHYYRHVPPPPPKMTPRRMLAVIDGAEVEFTLRERVARDKRTLTPEEERRKERRPWEFRHPRYTYTPTGRLHLKITTSVRGKTVRGWYDRGTRGVETKLGRFVVAAEDTAAAIKQQRAEAEEARRQREAWERERVEKLELIRKEEERVAGLKEEVDRWHRSQLVRAYIEAARDAAIDEHGTIAEGSRTAEWIRWATAQADRVDPLTESPPSILDEKPKWRGYW